MFDEFTNLFSVALNLVLKLSFEFLIHVLKSLFDSWYKDRKKKRKRKKKR